MTLTLWSLAFLLSGVGTLIGVSWALSASVRINGVYVPQYTDDLKSIASTVDLYLDNTLQEISQIAGPNFEVTQR